MEKPGRSLDDGQVQGSDKPRVTGRPRTQALEAGARGNKESAPGMGRRWIGRRGQEGILATHTGTSQGSQGSQGIPGPTRSSQGAQDHSGTIIVPEFKGLR